MKKKRKKKPGTRYKLQFSLVCTPFIMVVFLKQTIKIHNNDIKS